jgi:hypothetical protein
MRHSNLECEARMLVLRRIVYLILCTRFDQYIQARALLLTGGIPYRRCASDHVPVLNTSAYCKNIEKFAERRCIIYIVVYPDSTKHNVNLLDRSARISKEQSKFSWAQCIPSWRTLEGLHQWA